MNPNMFDHLVNSLKKNHSPEHLMYLMQVTIGASGIISPSQVSKLMKFFSSEHDKLELAKMAYGYVNDQGSYDDIVGEKFASNSTKAYLNQYINRH